MKNFFWALLFLSVPLKAEYVPIGDSGTLSLNKPFCGS